MLRKCRIVGVALVLAPGLTLTGCPAPDGQGGDGCGVVVPADWSAPDWGAHAVVPLALRAQLDALTGAAGMRGSEEGAVVVDDVADLTALYEAGDPSLKDIATADADARVIDAFAEFVELRAVGARSLVDAGGAWVPGAAGGLYGSSARGINEGGLEVRQIVDKSLFSGGGFYNYAAGLTAGAIDVATIDAIAAAWGNNSTLDPEDAAAALADSANYTLGMGLHQEGKDALIAARAYAADDSCVAERDEAIVDFFRTWEKAMFARFAFYANRCAGKAAAAVDDDGFADALHDLGEGVGLVLGFHGLPEPAKGPLAAAGVRVATDAQIADLVASIGINLADLGASTTGELVTESSFAPRALDVEADVAAVFGVDAAEAARWREPDPG